MNQVFIYWGGQLLDYFGEDNGLPLQLERIIDDWQNFAGSIGTKGAQFGDSIDIPTSKNNSRILLGSDDPLSDNQLAHLLPNTLRVVVAGSVLFEGSAYVSGGSYGEEGRPQRFTISILGDFAELWVQLDGKLLFDLNLGQVTTTPSDLVGYIFGGSVINTSPALEWPLINYGGRMITNGYLGTTAYKYTNGIRPAVRNWRIVEAIFASVGYAVEGEFYNSPAFRNSLHSFGNGDDWERNDNWQDFKAYIGATANQTAVNDGNIISFLNDAPPFYDAQGLGSGGFFDTNRPSVVGQARGAWWQFEFYFGGPNPNIEYDIIMDVGAGNTAVYFSGLQGGQVHRPDPVWFAHTVRENMYVRVRNVGNPGQPVAIPEVTYYKADMLQRFQFGAPLRIGSCLPRRDVRDFLLGLQHAFGLVFLVNNTAKTVTIEHRFIADLGESYPNYVQNRTKSYYKPFGAAAPLEIDQTQITLTNRKPFGDGLAVSFPPDGDDAGYKRYLQDLGEAYNRDRIPLYSFEYQLAGLGTPYFEKPNPYFTPLLNSKFFNTQGVTLQNNLYAPLIIDDEALIDFPNLDYENGIVANYKAAPKLLTFYGVLDFTTVGNLTNQWALERPDTNPKVQLYYQVPTAFQLYPDHPDYFDPAISVAAEPFNAVFPTYSYTYAPAGKVTGLLDKFYRRYLAITLQDKTITVRAKIGIVDFQQYDCRRPVLVTIHGQRVRCWIIRIEGYNPIESEFCTVTLLADADAIADLDLSLGTNQLRPVLLIGGEKKFVNDGQLL